MEFRPSRVLTRGFKPSVNLLSWIDARVSASSVGEIEGIEERKEEREKKKFGEKMVICHRARGENARRGEKEGGGGKRERRKKREPPFFPFFN